MNIIDLKAGKLTKKPCDSSTLYRTEAAGILSMVPAWICEK
jgi:hypothetical protein